ncbi:hypothetical protein [Sulfitobacter donghicola]|uniref:Uncharacterized protein n=1 Tax=Sulfitobacter donghicola DSW-25 = KCTC 12864 = JCM 14565 TaxID=1300350 RepID=A0A073IKM2_9RHOB|nr:hypothetical protein [Sulfitobacter donghicola]KEJ90319.1 hypothetical protein DSW25_07345 [Sulfitobacter donghicola DSW-25 = KCTC 12864 = JCM 14565]KIN66850.1 putative transmembrane protein [Sulfitobacter donghicola DSW-25 = KCTC 12864 = JCM 14565]
MAPALRLLRILATTAFCIILFAVFTEYAIGLRHRMPSDPVGPWLYFGWAIVFRAPAYVFLGTLPIAAILFALDRFRVQSWWSAFLPWILAGLLTSGVLGLLFVGPITGGIYWLINGRVSGRADPKFALLNDELMTDGAEPKPEPSIDESTIKSTGLKSFLPRSNARWALNFAGYAVVAYFLFIIAGGLFYGARLAWVSVFEPSRGTPEFTTQFEREMTARVKVAMLDFPNPDTCLKKEAFSDVGIDLTQMDWDRIDNSEEAEVCMFRLLASLGGMDNSEDWLEAQGFRVSPNSSNARNPYEERDGTLRVVAYWSIRDNGPKFPTRKSMRRLISSISYVMSINTAWSSDRSKLLYVGLGFITL